MLQPNEDRVVVSAIAPQDKSAGGIIIPEKAQKDTGQGRVVSVGPGRYLGNGKQARVPFRVGDLVVYLPKVAITVFDDDEELVVLRHGDVLGVKD